MTKQIRITNSLATAEEMGFAGTAKNGSKWVEVKVGEHEVGDDVVAVSESIFVPEGMSPRAARSAGCIKRTETLVARVTGFGSEYDRAGVKMQRAYIEEV